MSTDRRFARRLAATVGALALATGLLAVANGVQGPRVVAVEADVADATRLADAEVRFTLNAPVADVPADAVRVEPAASARVAVDGSEVVVAFDEPLETDRDYTLAVDGVTAQGGGPARTLEHRFTTGGEPLHVLQQRGDGEPDAVVRTMADGEPDVVLAAPGLVDFAHAGDVVAAVERTDAGDRLRFATRDDREGAVVELPAPGTVTSIAGSTTHPLIGFGVATSEAQVTLYTVDVGAAGAAQPQPVLGLDGAPIPVVEWAFVPGAASVVVRDPVGAMTLVDVSGVRPPAAIGSHQELRGFLPGTQRLVVADPDRGAIVDLRTGETTTLELPPADLPEGAYPGRVLALADDGTHLLDVLLTDGAGAFASLLVRADTAGTEIVHAPVEGSRIRSFCASPNGRLVAVETVPQEAIAGDDGADALTTLVEVGSGRVLASVAGGGSDWCR